MKKIIIIAFLLVVIAAGGWVYRSHRNGTEAALTLFGNVDIREVTLGFRVPGKLIRLECDEGDKVEAGQAIAHLDTEPYSNQVAVARAKVESMHARLELLETGYRPEEIAQAQALVNEREATVANAERLFKRSEEMLATKAVSTQDRDNAAAGFEEAGARLKSAHENLALLEAGFRPEEIAQAKANLAQAEAELSIARLQLEDTLLVAPSEGVVLVRAQEAGAILQAGATVFTLSLVKPVWIRAYVHEPDLGHIHPGMKVEVRTDSSPDKTYYGQIGYISPRAEFTPKTVETAELRTALVYRLRIVVDNPDEGLRQGMPVTVTISNKD